MSKKLIAVASAAALALSALVAAPAMSAGSSLVLGAGTVGQADGPLAGDGLASTTAWTVAVPSQDVLRATNTSSRTVLTLDIDTIENSASVTVTSTGSVKLLTAAQLAASTTTTATGTSSLTVTSNDSGDATVYAYNTSTSAGSVTVQEIKAGVVIAANTKWIKGVTDAANAYKINAVAPTTVGIGSKVEFTATVVDMFGNAIEDGHTIDVVSLGGDTTDPGNMDWNSTKKIYEGEFTARTTAGPIALSVPLAVSADAVTAFGAKSISAFFSINATDLQAANATLSAQVAALQAQIADMRTKARSVTLKRWNDLVLRHRALGGSAKLK
jgi:hypothetical protein